MFLIAVTTFYLIASALATDLNQFVDMTIEVTEEDFDELVRSRTYQDVRQYAIAKGLGDIGAKEADSDHWTPYLDYSNLSPVGQFENIKKFEPIISATSCQIWCDEPLALKWEVANREYVSDADAQTGLNVTGLMTCIYLDAKSMMDKKANYKGDLIDNTYKGFNCYNSKQMYSKCGEKDCIDLDMSTSAKKRSSVKCDICPNIRVKYLCPQPMPDNCPEEKRESGDSNKKRLHTKISEVELQELDTQLQENNHKRKELIERLEEIQEIQYEQYEKEQRKKEIDSSKDIDSLVKLLKNFLEKHK